MIPNGAVTIIMSNKRGTILDAVKRPSLGSEVTGPLDFHFGPCHLSQSRCTTSVASFLRIYGWSIMVLKCNYQSNMSIMHCQVDGWGYFALSLPLSSWFKYDHTNLKKKKYCSKKITEKWGECGGSLVSMLERQLHTLHLQVEDCVQKAEMLSSGVQICPD